MTLTLFGNSLAMMANDAVRNAALPNASMVRMMKADEINRACPCLPEKFIEIYLLKPIQMNVINSIYLHMIEQSKNNG